ncbi:hypothetical protein HUJ04_005060 [Dendroctonus ponderosae]|nr:hypothetical protein HUJ04_005060 [Dendroctonus ponderosae]
MAFIFAVALVMVVAHQMKIMILLNYHTWKCLLILSYLQAHAACILPSPGSLTAPPAPVPSTLALPCDACGPLKTQITQHPDINFDLPLPEEIPLGRFCACQKYGITPSLRPCPPRPRIPVPVAPAPRPAIVSIPAYAAPAPAPAQVVYSVPAPSAVIYGSPAACGAPAVSVNPASVSAFLRGGCSCA